MPVSSATSPEGEVRLDFATLVYVWGACLYATALVLANVTGVKLFQFQLPLPGLGQLPIEHTAGMLAFPITFVLTDLLNEYFGARATRLVVYVAFAMAVLAFGIISLARALPTLEGIPGTASAAAFDEVFGSASLMYIASVIAFLVGGLLDVFLFGLIKRLTQGRLIGLRATLSTVISQLFDSFVVTVLFFTVLPALLGMAVAPWAFVVKTALTGYILKFVLALLLTPIIYLGRALAERAGLHALPP